MACCVYDNPSLMRREAWQDGQMIAWVKAAVLLRKGFNGYPQLPFMLNIGLWEAGQIVGDVTAFNKRRSLDHAFWELIDTVKRANHLLQRRKMEVE